MVRYVALGEQSGLSTPSTPSHYIRITSVEVNPEGGNIYPELADSRFDIPAIAGAFKVSGSFEVPVELENIGYPLKYALGSVSSSVIDATVSLYEHVFTPVDFGGSLPSFTMAVGKDNITEETVVGCVINSVEFACSAKELLLATFEYGGIKSKLESLENPSFPSPKFVVYYKGQVKIGDTPRGEIEAITISINNDVNYDDAYRITRNNGRLPKEFPLGGLTVEVSFDARFTTTDYYKYFYGSATATEPQESTYPVSLELSFYGNEITLSDNSTTHKELTIYIPKFIIDSISVPVSGRDRLVVSCEGRGVIGTVSVANGSYHYPIVIYLKNKTSSY